MAHITSSVEYGIHCLLWLVDAGDAPVSSRDLAELQGVSPSFLAKIFPKLEKAGIVEATEGARGGYRLARPPGRITFLDIVDAIEGPKPLFDCQEIRGRCAVFGDTVPAWSGRGTCGIHAVMLNAERAMRQALADETLEAVGRRVKQKVPAAFAHDVQVWLHDRTEARVGGRRSQGGPGPDRASDRGRWRET